MLYPSALASAPLLRPRRRVPLAPLVPAQVGQPRDALGGLAAAAGGNGGLQRVRQAGPYLTGLRKNLRLLRASASTHEGLLSAVCHVVRHAYNGTG